jgi:hypothetical protein
MSSRSGQGRLNQLVFQVLDEGGSELARWPEILSNGRLAGVEVSASVPFNNLERAD